MNTSEIRKKYIQLLSGLLGIPGYDTMVPIGESPTAYFVVSNVARTTTAPGKGQMPDNSGFRRTEDRVFVNVDFNVWTEWGVHSSLEVEQFIDLAVHAITRGLQPDGYHVKETKVTNLVPLHTQTTTHRIQRMVLSFEHWVHEKRETSAKIIDNNPANAEHNTIFVPENMNRDWDFLFDANDPGQSGTIYAPVSPCFEFGNIIDDNPAEDEQHIIYAP